MNITRKLAMISVLGLIILGIFSCGHGTRTTWNPTGGEQPDARAQAPIELANVEWPAGLPSDGIQPWETLEGGRVVASSSDAHFIPGIERFLEAGNVSNFGEASSFASGEPGGKGVSFAIYRMPMGGAQPSIVSIDANLHAQDGASSSYYIGVADYSSDTWRWHGPFADSHVLIPLPPSAYTSPFGNLMLAVVAYDGAGFDLAGLGATARDGGDSEAPPTPDTPVLTPAAGGIFAQWDSVQAQGIAGYRIYAGGSDALGYVTSRTSAFIPASSDTQVTVSCVDMNGNESAPSPSSSATPLAGEAPQVTFTASAASGRSGSDITLSASGAASYDWDLDGDGEWEVTGDHTGLAQARTSAPGVVRPALRAHAPGGGMWTGAISLIIAGNTRPAMSVIAYHQSGLIPLAVDFEMTAMDNDGQVVEYAWDFEGDGIYDGTSAVNPGAVHNTYLLAGLYNAKFRATDNDGGWSTDTAVVSAVTGLAAPGNTAPIASLVATPDTGTPPLAVTLDASGSYDPDAGDAIVQYMWDIDGDGSYEKITYTPTLNVVYDTPGIPVPTVACEDSHAAVGEASAFVVVNALNNIVPTAALTAVPTFGNVPLTVAFDASTSSDSDGTIVRFDWDFDGDGFYEAYNAGSTPSWTYTSPGNYDARVRVTDNAGAQATAFTTISALVPNNLDPVASLSPATAAGDAPLVVNFDASASSDPDGVIVRYDYDFNGDGIWDAFDSAAAVTWTYTVPGAYTARLRVTDSSRVQNITTSAITVNALPVAVLIATPPEGEKGVTVFYDASASADADGALTDYEWDLDNNGTFNEVGAEENARGLAGAQVTYPVAGIYTATVRVTDNALTPSTSTASATATVHGWTTQTIFGGTPIASYGSILTVNGNPAVAYRDDVPGDLMYIRATSPDTSSWGTPVAVVSAGNVGFYCSLAIVAGNPAIAYFDNTALGLKYVRANDANGTSWGTPVTVDGGGSPGYYTSMTVVNGAPAISYYQNGNSDLKYARAADAFGATWNTPLVIEGAGFVGKYSCLRIVSGYPAVSYLDELNGNLKFIRATDASGTSWNTPLTIDSVGNVGLYTSMEIINGNPAITYFNSTNNDLMFVRAIEPTGTLWGTPVAADSAAFLFWNTSLAVVDGNPAVAYYSNGTYDLRYVRSLDTDGDVWLPPLIVDSTGDVGAFADLYFCGSDPVICYNDWTNLDLKFARLY